MILCRPYRAYRERAAFTQGVALGYNLAALQGWHSRFFRRRFRRRFNLATQGDGFTAVHIKQILAPE